MGRLLLPRTGRKIAFLPSSYSFRVHVRRERERDGERKGKGEREMDAFMIRSTLPPPRAERLSSCLIDPPTHQPGLSYLKSLSLAAAKPQPPSRPAKTPRVLAHTFRSTRREKIPPFSISGLLTYLLCFT